MQLSRILKESKIKLEMDTVIEPLEDTASHKKWQLDGKILILDELVSLLENGARIGNRTKLLNDFVNREKKASTALGRGVAIPHIRSLQAKDFMIGIARSENGYDFDAPDGNPTHLFMVMAAPPYDDSFYLKVFKSLAGMLRFDWFREELMSATSPGEIVRTIRSME